MCRLFAQLSAAPTPARPYLADSAYSLLRQSDADPKRPQKDGWGIAYFEGRRPVLVKSAGAASKERRRFEREAEKAVSRSAVAHLRAASNPLGLPISKLISKANSQPFTDGRVLFAHNGTLEIPLEVARTLGPLRRNLRSRNDSEVYFWQFIKHYRKTRDVAQALKLCVKEDWDLWRKCRDKHPDKEKPYTSLNALIAEPTRLHAFCHAFRPKPARSLFTPGLPWTVMTFARRDTRLLVSSEGLDRKPWKRLTPPALLTADVDTGRLRVSVRELQLPLPRNPS